MPYISISPSETDSGSDITDSLMERIRDNWDSCCAGESGAPRFKTQAVDQLTAGWQWAWSQRFSGNSPTWFPITRVTNLGITLYRWQAWRTGSYRFWIAMNRTTTTSASHAQVYRNGVPYSPVYSAAVGVAGVNHIFDLSFSVGDEIDIYIQSSALCHYSFLCGMVSNAFAYIG